MVSFYAAVSPLLLVSCLNYISGCERNTVEDSYFLENIRRDIRCFDDDKVCSDVDGFERLVFADDWIDATKISNLKTKKI